MQQGRLQDGEAGGGGDTFARYCDDVERTAAWGGDMELNALAAAMQRHIQVHCVGMPPVDFGASFKGMLPASSLLDLQNLGQPDLHFQIQGAVLVQYCIDA